MSRWSWLVAACLLTACNTRTLPTVQQALPPESNAPLPAPSVEVSIAPPPVAPPVEAAPEPKPSEEEKMQGDLDGDGHSERVYLTKEGLVRIVSDSGTELFQAQLPSKAAVGVAMERVPVSDQVSLLHIHWRWCLRDYPANVFIWFNRQTGHFETDRGAEGVAYTCGMYAHQGQGRFNILARNDDFVYKANVHWQDGQFTRETSVTEVLYVQLDRLPIVLSQLGATDVDNPGRLFDSPDLYKQFKSKVGKAWRFQPGASKAANTLELQATSTDGESHGTLSVSYRVQGAFKENIVITGLTWSPGPVK